MKRKRRSYRERMRLFELHGRACHICGQDIRPDEPWDLDHVVEWHLTQGDESDENVRPAHRRCHGEKTARRQTDLAKVERIRAKHLGAWPKSKRPLKSRGFERTR